MIKNFFIINFTGKNDSIGLKVDNNFFVKKLQTNIRKNDLLVNSVFVLISEKKVKIDKNFSILHKGQLRQRDIRKLLRGHLQIQKQTHYFLN